MQIEQPAVPATVQMISRALAGPLKPGEIGVLMAPAGLGKTACLTHIALENLFQGSYVLHVCIDDVPDKAKVWYRELLKHVPRTEMSEDSAQAIHRLEPRRFISAYLKHTFTPEKLEHTLTNLREQMSFQPAMVVLDGLDFDSMQDSTLETLRDFAEKYGVSIWMSARTHRHITDTNERGVPYPCNNRDGLFNAIMLLEATPKAIRVKVLKRGEVYQPQTPEVLLNPETFLLEGV